jgi:hypothetical protein
MEAITGHAPGSTPMNDRLCRMVVACRVRGLSSSEVLQVIGRLLRDFPPDEARAAWRVVLAAVNRTRRPGESATWEAS